jgi:hypothetical protein
VFGGNVRRSSLKWKEEEEEDKEGKMKKGYIL